MVMCNLNGWYSFHKSSNLDNTEKYSIFSIHMVISSFNYTMLSRYLSDGWWLNDASLSMSIVSLSTLFLAKSLHRTLLLSYCLGIVLSNFDQYRDLNQSLRFSLMVEDRGSVLAGFQRNRQLNSLSRLVCHSWIVDY